LRFELGNPFCTDVGLVLVDQLADPGGVVLHGHLSGSLSLVLDGNFLTALRLNCEMQLTIL
jgi:hypothetical protein